MDLYVCNITSVCVNYQIILLDIYLYFVENMHNYDMGGRFWKSHDKYYFIEDDEQRLILIFKVRFTENIQ
jgi:hypothetical protein